MPVASKTIVAGFGGALGKHIDAGLVDRVEKLMQSVPCSGRSQRVAVGLRRQGKAVRHPDALIRQNRIELAKRRVLSAHRRNIVQPNVAEPAYGIAGSIAILDSLIYAQRDMLILLSGRDPWP